MQVVVKIKLFKFSKIIIVLDNILVTNQPHLWGLLPFCKNNKCNH